MPDWTYQTLFQPLLFRLPAPRARALTLDALHCLGSHWLGPRLIALMGHTRPAPSLARTYFGLHFPAPVLVGAELGGNERALGALARFGVGAVEVGPVMLEAGAAPQMERKPQEGLILLRGEHAMCASDLEAQLARVRTVPARVAVRLAYRPGADAEEAAAERVALIRRLSSRAELFTLEPPSPTWEDEAWAAHLAAVVAASRSRERPIVVGVAADSNERNLERWLDPAIAAGVDGVLVCGRVAGPDGSVLLGTPAHAAVLATVRAIRVHWGSDLPVIAGGGGPEPADALALLDAGANLVQLDAGLVFGGPGLPKRINEALRARVEPRARAAHPRSLPGWLTVSWLWMLLLGLGMVVGGALAWLVAATSVVLPYDLAFVGMSREQLAAINPRLLPYMAHNRIALAGSMLSIGVLYTQLALHAVRVGTHWAHAALSGSAATGFLSFFLFLGYGYFDPLHAYVSLLLLPLFLLGLRARADAPPAVPTADLHNDRAWRLAQWGQLGAVTLGVGLIGAGITIAIVGMTSVFVPEDLAFLCMSAEAMRSANGQLAALVAHDRAGLGGALVSNGLGVLLLSLWGVRRGARWVWWTLLLAGAPGFVAALGVHGAIGYVDLWHLAPGLAGLALFVVTLGLLGPYLLRCATGSTPRQSPSRKERTAPSQRSGSA